MIKPIVKWTIILGALLVVGPIAGRLVGSMRSPAGGWDTTALLSRDLVMGLAKVAGAIAMAAAMGILASRLFGSRSGLTVAGLVLAWPAWSTASVDQLLAQWAQARPVLMRLAAEGLFTAAAGLAVAYAILKAGARADDRTVVTKPAPKHADADRGAMVASLVAAAALGGLVVWWIAFQPLKGQAIFAVIAGSIAAAAAAHLAGPHLPARTGALIAFVALGLLAAAGPVSALYVGGGAPGGASGLRAAAAGIMSHMAFPTGLDWLAGAFLGIPIGLSWSGSMVDRHMPKPAAA